MQSSVRSASHPHCASAGQRRAAAPRTYARRKQAIDESVVHLIDRDAVASEVPALIDRSAHQTGAGAPLSDETVEFFLSELASAPASPHLPANSSRAKVDCDHE